jgi:hypothetical protein
MTSSALQWREHRRQSIGRALPPLDTVSWSSNRTQGTPRIRSASDRGAVSTAVVGSVGHDVTSLSCGA